MSRNATMSKLITSGLRCKHMNCNYFNPWSSQRRLQSTTENTRYFPRATPVDKRPPHTSATPFLASLKRPVLYHPYFGTNGSEQTGLPSWKVAWSYVENFSTYSRSKLIKVDQLFRGVFKRSSNRNTYRNEAFKDIFSCRGKSL